MRRAGLVSAMLTLLLASIALADPAAAASTDAGGLTIDAKVPAEIRLDGHIVGQFFVPGRLEVPVEPGEHKLAVVRDGKPEELAVRVPDEGAVVVVGKTGTTLGPALAADRADPHAPVEVEVRVSGNTPVQLRLGDQRFDLSPGRVIKVELPVGTHGFSFRNRSGTLIWAKGELELAGGPVVMQIAEGRMPELSGDARIFGDAG